MKTTTIYSLKIKIVSLQFKIRAIQPPIFFTMSLGDTILNQQQVEFKNGLLKNNLSLTAQVSQHEISHFAQVTLTVSEKDFLKQNSIGTIKLSFQEFMNSKIKKINIKNCFDSSAYIEAFLILLPQRIIEENENGSSNQTGFITNRFSSKFLTSPQKHFNQSRSTKGIAFKDCQKDGKETKQNLSSSFGTQTYDVESLLKLNQTLRENNQKLKKENLFLKTKSQELEEKINNLAKRLQKQQTLKSQIQELENKVLQKQFQIASKDQINATLRQQKQSLAQEMQMLKQTTGIKQELKIDTIVAQLGKYADTAKKYKSKLTIQQPNIMPKLTLASTEHTKQSIIKTSRNRKEQLKYLLTSKNSRLNCDQTLDTLGESSNKR